MGVANRHDESTTEAAVDVVCIGGGLGGLAAAVRARGLGLSVLVLERSSLLGGVAAFSGGRLWVPCSHLARLAGHDDDVDEAARYLDFTVGPDADPDLGAIRGLVYRNGTGVVFNSAAPLVTNPVADMPGVAWDLMPVSKYRAHNWHCFGHLEREPYAAIYTTLGCPYHCSFCCIQAPFKGGEQVLGLGANVNSYRFWSPERVIKEIDILVNTHGVRNLKFADEMFVLNPRHVIGICDLIIERGYDLNIWAYARVDTVKDAMLDKLKRAGVHWLAFGIEAANEGVLADVDKRYRVDEVYETIRKVKAAGINIIGNYIFGLPEDTTETMEETLRLAQDLECEFANFYTAMAYPGSLLHDQAVQQGWRLPDTWSGYSQHAVDTLPLPTRHLSAGEVLRFRDRAFTTYFTDESSLGFVQEKFGGDTVSHIKEMTSHRLERRYAAS